jgi:hypothetical protein
MLAATMRTPRWYVYKCVVDDGAAPCVDDGLLSLTICKPFIRSTAKKDDLIFAFGSNNEQPANRLVYVAKVTRRIPHGQYFELSEFHHRKDAIYERTTGGELRRRCESPPRRRPPPARPRNVSGICQGERSRLRGLSVLRTNRHRYLEATGTAPDGACRGALSGPPRELYASTR